MTPKQVEVDIKGNAGTSDGVAVQGRVSVQLVVKDDLQIIKCMVINAEEEENLLRARIVTAIQETIASHTWHKVVSVGEELTKATEEKLLHLLQLSNSCFMVRSLTIQEIRPLNKEFADSLEKAARAREDEKLQKELATLRAERAVLERHAKKEEAEGEIELQSLRLQVEMNAERHKLKLSQEKDEARILIQTKLSELLKTEEGRIAVLPKETFAYLMREIDARILDAHQKEEFYRELIRRSQSFQAGQFDAMRAFLEQHLDIRLSEKAPALPEGKEAKKKPQLTRPDEEKTELEKSQEENEATTDTTQQANPADAE